jgi:hypothetical protein
MERLYRPPCSLPEFGEEFEPDLTRRCAKFANAITTSPHLAQNVDAIRFDVVIVPDLFMGTMVLEREIIAKLLAKLTRLRRLTLYVVDQPTWYLPPSRVPWGLSTV